MLVLFVGVVALCVFTGAVEKSPVHSVCGMRFGQELSLTTLDNYPVSVRKAAKDTSS